MPTLTVTYRDDDTVPDKVRALAEQNGIDVETQLKRLIQEALHDYFPPQHEFSGFNDLEDFLKRGGYRK